MYDTILQVKDRIQPTGYVESRGIFIRNIQELSLFGTNYLTEDLPILHFSSFFGSYVHVGVE